MTCFGEDRLQRTTTGLAARLSLAVAGRRCDRFVTRRRRQDERREAGTVLDDNLGWAALLRRTDANQSRNGVAGGKADWLRRLAALWLGRATRRLTTSGLKDRGCLAWDFGSRLATGWLERRIAATTLPPAEQIENAGVGRTRQAKDCHDRTTTADPFDDRGSFGREVAICHFQFLCRQRDCSRTHGSRGWLIC